MKKYIIALLALVLSFAGLQNSKAQDNTLYMMQQLPGVMEVNPAIQPEYGGFLKLPGLASVQLGVQNTGFKYWDLIHFGSGNMSDSLVLDLDQAASQMATRNYLRVENAVNILSFGFRLNESYLSFGITNRTEVRLGYPRGLLDVRDGNFNSNTGNTQDIDFSGLGIDAINYTEIAIGYSREIIEGLTVGGKIKRLMGAANIHASQADLVLETDQENYTMNARADMRFNVSAPISIQRNDNDEFDGVDFPGPDVMSDFVFNKNGGFAFDVGATYKLDDRFDFSAAIVDLGGIKWDNNTHEFKVNGVYAFDGINVSPDENGDIILEDELNNIPDSLVATFTPEVSSGGEYVSMLTTKFFLNANYRFSDNIAFSALNRNLIYDGRIHPELTLGAELTPGNWFTAKATYSMMARSYNNFGLGLGIRAGVFQLYVVQDNISSLFWPHNAQAYTMRFGINITWGFQEKLDQSLIE